MLAFKGCFAIRHCCLLMLSKPGLLCFLEPQDHTKVILCPLMAAVTYINERREFHTYKLALIEEFGCCKELASRLRYAQTMVEKLLCSKSGPTTTKAPS